MKSNKYGFTMKEVSYNKSQSGLGMQCEIYSKLLENEGLKMNYNFNNLPILKNMDVGSWYPNCPFANMDALSYTLNYIFGVNALFDSKILNYDRIIRIEISEDYSKTIVLIRRKDSNGYIPIILNLSYDCGDAVDIRTALCIAVTKYIMRTNSKINKTVDDILNRKFEGYLWVKKAYISDKSCVLITYGDSKIICRRSEVDKPDPYNAFCSAFGKMLFGNGSIITKIVRDKTYIRRTVYDENGNKKGAVLDKYYPLYD